MDDTTFDFDTFGATFLARDLHRLRVLISDQSDRVFEASGVDFPSHCASVVLYLERADEASVMTLAAVLGYSHQLVMQRLNILTRRELVRRYKDPGDRRRTLVSLTKKGRAQARKLGQVLQRIDEGLSAALSDVDPDLQGKVRRLGETLRQTPLLER